MNMNQEEVNKFKHYIGKQVFKSRTGREPKKFKSGLKHNTVKDVIEHPYLLTPAFTFEEDDSFVECNMCRFIEEETNTKTTNIGHKNKCLDKAKNQDEKLTMIYNWCVTGQLLKQEFIELLNHARAGISKGQIKKQEKHQEDPEIVMG